MHTRSNTLIRQGFQLGRNSALILAFAVLSGYGMANAQAVYRIVGPDGKVTFSDRPPAGTNAAPSAPLMQPASGSRTSEGATSGNVPASLKPVVSKYPVTLYTATPCPPCEQARALLKQRGIPFTEKTVNTQADVAAFQKLAPGAGGFPHLMVGAQAVQGFMASEWNSYLDAAGYPQTSSLPANYSHAPAQPLVPPKPIDPNAPTTPSNVQEADAGTAPSNASTASQRRVRPAPTPKRSDENPAGIRF